MDGHNAQVPLMVEARAIRARRIGEAFQQSRRRATPSARIRRPARTAGPARTTTSSVWRG
jgi:hypothetical protein